MIVKLGDIASYINGYAFKPSDWSNTGIPIIRIQDLTGNSYQMNRYDGDIDSKYKVFDGDVLISWSASLGVYEWHGEDAVLNQHIFKVVFDKQDVVKNFFIYQLENILQSAASKVHGATMKHLTRATFNELPFILPSKEEQYKIASVLHRVSELIIKCKMQISLLDELVKSRFVELFEEYIKTGGKPLSELATITGGLTKNSKRNTFDLKMPYLRVANVFFNRLDLNDILKIGVREEEIEKTLLQAGDLLFVEGNGSIEQIGRVAIWDGSISPILHQNHLIKARFNEKTVIPEFALYYFMSQEGRQQIISKSVSTSGLNTLSVNKIGSLILPLPPLTIQNDFTDFVAQVDKSKYCSH